MAIKMGHEKDKHVCCLSCNNTIAKSKEMYKIGIGTGNSNLLCINLCDACANNLMLKIIRAQSLFNGKVKSHDEIKKINAIDKARNGLKTSGMSINKALSGIEVKDEDE